MSGVVSRIAKLHRKAVSARELGNEAEADAFDRKVRALLDEHDLSIDAVLEDAEDDGGVAPVVVPPEDFGHEPEPSVVHVWISNVAACVSQFHDCAAMTFPNRNAVGFVGRPSARDAAARMFCRIVRRLDSAADAMLEALQRSMATNSTTSSSGTTTFYNVTWVETFCDDGKRRESWLCGASQTVADRVLAAIQERKAQAAAAGAVVPTGRRDELRAWIEERFQPPPPRPGPGADPRGGSRQGPPPPTDPPGSIVVDPVAFREGAEHAREVNLYDEELPEVSR